MIRKFFDFIYPMIEERSAAEEQAHTDAYDRDMTAIDSANWGKQPAKALEQAQRMADSEVDRRKVVETKASIYLAVLAALVPLIVTIQTGIWENKVGPAPPLLRFSILSIAIIYSAAAGWYAFSVLRVSGFHTVGIGELTTSWAKAEPPGELAKKTLQRMRDSQDAVNNKVTRIKVTHEHLLRAFGFFITLMLIDPAAYALEAALEKFHNQAAERPIAIVDQPVRQTECSKDIERTAKPKSTRTQKNTSNQKNSE